MKKSNKRRSRPPPMAMYLMIRVLLDPGGGGGGTHTRPLQTLPSLQVVSGPDLFSGQQESPTLPQGTQFITETLTLEAK